MKFKSAVPAILILILISAAEGFSQPLVSPVAVLPDGRTEFIAGDIFTVRIDVGTNEAVSSLYGVSFVLNYNSSLLTATQAIAGDFLGADPVFFQTLESGEVAIGTSAKTGSGSDGSGTVAEVTFQISAGATSGATANFQITDVVAVDPSGADMTLSGGTEDITIYTGSEITPSTTDVSIGNVNVGSSGSGTFTITNNGDIDLVVSSVTSSNPTVFTTDYADGGTIVPAGNQVVTVTFTPTAPGAQSSTISVTSNDDDESTIYVTVTGTGIGPEITLSTTTVNIGNVSLGTSGTGTFTITNDGNEDLIVNSVTSSNPPVFTTDYSDGGTIAPAANQLVTVTFSPTSIGAQSATITVTSNDGDEATITVTATGTGTAPEITLSTTSVDIGNVSLGTSGNGTFSIRNDGNENLVVSSITSDNGVFAVSPSSATLAPGANQPVTITFSPTTAGAQSAAITVTSNDADEATVTVTINGTGLSPDITLSTTIVAIGNVALGSNGSGSFTITNDGGADLTITSIASDNTLFTVSPSSVTIAPGGNQLVTVTFSPDAAGARSATVTISTDQGNLTVTATGTGIAPDITLSDASVSIGNVNAGSTGSGSFTITNNGDADLVVTSITSDNALFTISPSSATIAPGGNQIVTISFSPTASGTRNSIITILSNDTDEGTLTLTASGNGSAPEIGLSTNSLSLGGITVGESGSADFTIHNSGIGDLVISSISSDNGSFTVDPSSATIDRKSVV